ncbi:hypothetical protein GF345_05535 [Candidatus Woesearchaeota archaeon]|nr:hypothetical protein [Candidatus Woesearchaeota archaeon]
MRHIIALTLLIALVLAACGSETAETTPDIVQEDADDTEPVENDVEDTPPAQSLEDQLRDLEITPSGDDKCFLSPCDCNCYPVKNVPVHAKRPTCAFDCRSEYGITGCRFTNFQCTTIG